MLSTLRIYNRPRRRVPLEFELSTPNRPSIAFLLIFLNNRSGSIWFTLIIFVIFRLFYPFRLSCSSTAHKAIIYIHGLDTGETLDNTIYFATWNRGSRPRPVTWEKAVNRRMGKHFDFHVSKRLFIDFYLFTPFAFGKAMNQRQATISFLLLFRWLKGQLWIWKQVDHRHRNYRDWYL